MKAEILCVGTELLLGDIVNTNAAFIARELARMGIDLYNQSVVGDNPDRLKNALTTVFDRADLVITTGGLGPTFDDLTKETVAAYFGKGMTEDAEALRRIKEYHVVRDLPLAPNNLKQAQVPEGAVVFQNDNGTAPGMAVEGKGKVVIMLPGPPREMVPMMLNSVVPYLMKYSGKTIVSHTIHLFGIGESMLEHQMKEYMLAHTNPTIAPYAKEAEVQLRVTASAPTHEEADALIKPVVDEICEMMSKYVYGVDIDSMQNALVQLLTEKNLKIATAESCSGGLFGKRITEIPGSSKVYEYGVITYSNAAKRKLLGVSDDILNVYGAVSEECAAAMAKGVRELSGADIGVAITGIAGPDGGTAEKPVGLVYIAVSSDAYSHVTKLQNGKNANREHVRFLSTSSALWNAIKAAKKTDTI